MGNDTLQHDLNPQLPSCQSVPLPLHSQCRGAANAPGKRDESLSFVRAVSMLFILFCHLGNYWGEHVFGVFFSIGVSIFMLLSGCLYGQKTITAWGTWYRRRWLLLMVPVYVFLAFIALSGGAIGTTYDWKAYLTYILNLQGVSWFSPALTHHAEQLVGEPLAIPGLGHLWFLTAIMLCYMLLPLMQWVRDLYWFRSYTCRVVGMLLLFAASLVLGYIVLGSGGLYALICIVTFAIGYYLRIGAGPLRRHAFPIALVVALMAGVLRIFGLSIDRMPGPLCIYGSFIIGTLSVLPLALSLFTLLRYIYLRGIRFFRRIPISRFDASTYYIYIVHYVFLTGMFSVAKICPDSKLLGTFLFLLLTALAAALLQLVCAPLLALLRRLGLI